MFLTINNAEGQRSLLCLFFPLSPWRGDFVCCEMLWDSGVGGFLTAETLRRKSLFFLRVFTTIQACFCLISFRGDTVCCVLLWIYLTWWTLRGFGARSPPIPLKGRFILSGAFCCVLLYEWCVYDFCEYHAREPSPTPLLPQFCGTGNGETSVCFLL